MTPAIEKALDDVRGAWRFRWFAFAAAVVVAAAGWTVVFALPDRYQSTASVFVDTRTPLKPALKDLTVEQDVDAQINYVRQSLLARPTLEKIARETGVLPDSVTNERERERIAVDALRSHRAQCVERRDARRRAQHGGHHVHHLLPGQRP
jgi:uncharacterized protein involved in exopolysaccharide biosynthesis